MLKFLVSAQLKFASLRDNLIENESGNAAEYGLIIGIVAVGIVIGLGVLAGALSGLFKSVAAQL
jgi:Flp pilus assembly pilin Flp